MEGGLYSRLVAAGLLVPHEEADASVPCPPGFSQVIHPRQVPYISYAGEWCFSQLRDAALTTLRIQQRAVAEGMSLSDATSSNIQFLDGAAVWIDTSSLVRLRPETPWLAYGQFCREFLGPLALAARCHPDLQRVTELWMGGMPLHVVSRLLPRRTWLSPGLLVHIHLHGWMERRTATRPRSAPNRNGGGYSAGAHAGLAQSLMRTVRRLRPRRSAGKWSDYYGDADTGTEYVAAKRKLVAELLAMAAPKTVWDLGANVGTFSRVAREAGAQVVAWDSELSCVEDFYQACRARPEKGILPLLLDLTNPSPARGWDGTERPAWCDRGKPDLVMALALLHHLAIGNNVPLERLARFFARHSPWLLIEFVPKQDPRIHQMLALREDIFPGYTAAGFEHAFGAWFDTVRTVPVPRSERVLYLLRRRASPASKP